jgi:hypothetical protein
MQQARALRPMGLLEIIDQTFRLYRANFGLFFGITAVIFIPLGVLWAWPLLMAAGVLFTMVASVVTLGPLTKAVSDRYLDRPTDVASAYRYMRGRFLAYVLTLILAGLFVLVGGVLLFVGAFVFGFWCAFVVQTFVIEDKTGFAAIWRSKFLVGKGVWAEVVAISFVMNVFSSIIEYAVVLPASALLVGAAGGSYTGFSPGMLVFGLLTGAVQALVFPLALVALILLYYDSRIRKEGFDLQMLAREMGATLPQPAVPAPSVATPPASRAQPVAPPSAAGPPTAPAAPPPAQPARPAWQPSDARLASRMPLSALRRIFVFTDSDGRATPNSAVVLDTVQDTAGAPVREFETRVPVHIIGQSNAAAEVTRTRTVPEPVWEAMSRIDADLTARARGGQARTCVRGFEDPGTREHGVIIMVYDA